MIIYLFCFFISILLLYYSNRIKNNDLAKKIITYVALLIPCVLAGLRASNIGTDINVYLKNLFLSASASNSFKSYLSMGWFLLWKNVYVNNYEMGFVSIVYIVTKITNNMQCVLFIVQALVIFPLYNGLKKYDFLKNKLWLSMLVYYLMLYNVSLNLMRQFIGISFVFWGLSCIINRDKHSALKYIILQILGMLFHTSSIIGIIILAIYFLLRSNKKLKYLRLSNKVVNINVIYGVGILLISFLLIMNLNILNSILNLFNFDRYDAYISGNVIFLASKVIRIIPIISIFIYVRKSFLQKDNAWFYLVIYLLNEVVLAQLSSVAGGSHSGRVGYAFQMFSIISLPLLCESIDNKKSKKIINCLLGIYLIFYWWYVFAYQGYNETIPFKAFWD